MFTLSTFYRSKEWESLRNQLRIERVDNNGDVICEYCRKPIVKAYDIIAHHKTYLTESNVNDYSISLNPDNIQLVHFRCHNLIHDKGFKPKRVYIVYGSPCSGKSYYVDSVATADDLIIDIDRIYEALNITRSNKLLNTVMSTYRHLIDIVKTRNGQWTNAYIVRGFPYAMERQRLADTLDAELIFIDTDKQTCLERSKEKGSDYYKFVEDWFNKYQQ
jgi:hypothetical protein